MGQWPWEVVESGYDMDLKDKGSFTVKPVPMVDGSTQWDARHNDNGIGRYPTPQEAMSQCESLARKLGARPPGEITLDDL